MQTNITSALYYAIFLLWSALWWSRSYAAPHSILDFAIDGNPPYDVSVEVMQQSLVCPNGTPAKDDNPVLLVHGTGSTGSENWGLGYVPGLLAKGMKSCYVNLPNRSLADAQLSAAYVAYNLHYLSYLSSAPVAAVGHSQGGIDIQWALRFFPSTRETTVTRSFVALSPDFYGVSSGFHEMAPLCEYFGIPLCAASIWQQQEGSNYMSALRGGSQGPNHAYVPTTVVWSDTDEVVTPDFNNSRLDGAVAYAAQDLCPWRIVEHLLMSHDAAGFAIAVDALQHGGHANLSRVSDDACSHIVAPEMDPTLSSLSEAGVNDILKGIILSGPKTSEEPPLKSYAA